MFGVFYVIFMFYVCHMNESNIVLVSLYLVYISFGIYVIYQKKEPVFFNSLGANFFFCKNGYCRKNQPVIGPVVN